MRYRKIINIDPSNESIQILLVIYYEKTNELPRARELLTDILKDSKDAFTLLDASRFLERNGYEEELGLVLEKVFRADYIELYRNEFIERKFFYLLRQGNLQNIYSFYNEIDESSLDEIVYTKIAIEFFRLKGDVLNVALKLEELYHLTKINTYLLRSANYFLRANNLTKAESILKFISTNKLIETPELYMLYSTLEVFNSNYDKAFEYAKKAKDFSKDNPKSRSHPFFAGISLRCNRMDDWMSSMQEYLSDYPNNGWIKAVKVIEEDENGQKKLTKEGEGIFNPSNEGYQSLQFAYKNQQIGISTYIKYSGNDITQIIFAKNFSKQKLKITNGDINEVHASIKLIKEEILIDSSSLFILAEAGLLNLLDEFKVIYITYTTIECLQFILSSTESSFIRSVFDYINKSVNVKYVPVDTAILLEFEQKEAYLEETIHCASYSVVNNIPFLNTDFNFKNSLKDKGANVVNIVAVLKSIQQKDERRSKLISDAIVKLKLFYYDFINFDSVDLYNLSLTVTSQENIIDKFKVYLSMDRYSDIVSFVDVYIGFLKIINSYESNDTFLAYTKIIIKYIDNYISKSEHYFHVLTIQYPELFSLITQNNLQNNLISLDYLESIVNQTGNVNVDLYNVVISQEFQRAKAIISGCTRGINLFLKAFGQTEEELEYYHQLLVEVCTKIDEAIIDQINQSILSEQLDMKASIAAKV